MTTETKKALAGTILIIATFILLSWISSLGGTEEEVEETVESQCDFVVKTNQLPAHISEPTAGEHVYQIVATSDGYITIYQCQ